VRAFEMLPPRLDAALAVHGDPDRYPAFAQELRDLAANDRRVSFRGPFSRDELGRVMSEIDVLVVPSRWYENAPAVIFEAFAARAPVVATDLGGMSEFVRHGENGLLFELENAEDLSRQLRRLCEEPGLLEGLRAGIGPVKTLGEFTDELEEIYDSLVREE
jgi:glycosyltransferase involved in cell wall biosynthesis